MIRILSVLPELLNVNGDAENAAVLARRARWAGIDAEVVTESRARPDLVVIGSGVDASLGAVASALHALADDLRSWLADGTALLAVGTGFELLGEGVQVTGGEWIDGLAILPGRAIAMPARVSDDLVVDSRFGRLIGYENHARGYLLPADAGALGTVAFGHGNDGRSEGAVSGNAYGTHLTGPVLAKNPTFADALLTSAAPDYLAGNERARRVDGIAKATRTLIATRLELAVES
jgi:hypothetical protein